MKSGFPILAATVGILLFSEVSSQGAVTCPIECLAAGIPACDSGWSRFGSHCYKYFDEAGLAWTAAKERCEKEGAHLTSIHSEEENKFLASLVPKDAAGETYVFIGGTDAAAQGTFVWTDGSAWDYNNWMPGQPDGLPDEDCSEFNFAQNTLWNDQKCTHPRGKFICKKK
eukprot:TRINITY_DN264_c0_g1_i2.p1 TRINITY_DN264_c0_g1~~TRINITY_DN264_c0_g1_i2.p1  ORF type:complete len:170 (-),score=40.67 TRINITY_DN264_c0_g1_i2:136-645(-)